MFSTRLHVEMAVAGEGQLNRLDVLMEAIQRIVSVGQE
jgi:hypothetical protein